ncbi:MAG: hypothetical protein AB8B62_16170 [Roseobacter sp.]
MDLNDTEINAIVVFLESLSGEELLIEDPDIPEIELFPMTR